MYKEILTKSMKDVFENANAILKALVIPGILLFLIDIVSAAFLSQGFLGLMFSSILNLLVNMIILISVHRILILGADSIPVWGIGKYTQREFSFLRKYVILFVGIVLVLVSLFYISAQSPAFSFIIIVAFVIALIAISRLSLVFPSIAIDENMTFADSWRYTKSYKLLSFTTIIIFPFIFTIIVGGIYALVIKFLGAILGINLDILFVLLSMMLTVFFVSALSNTYMYIIYHSENGIYDEDESNHLDD